MFKALAIEFVPFFHNTPFGWSKLKEICVKKDPTPKKGRLRIPKPINNASFLTMQTFLKTGKKNFNLWYDYSTVNKFSIYSGSLKFVVWMCLVSSGLTLIERPNFFSVFILTAFFNRLYGWYG